MATLAAVEKIKEFATLLSSSYPDGAVMTISDDSHIIWKTSSPSFDVPSIKAGDPIPADSILLRCLHEKKILNEQIARSIHGIRLFATAIPFVEEDQSVYVLTTYVPLLHPIVQAFYDFAPIITSMFPEGAFIYNTDLSLKIGEVQGCEQFTVPHLQIGKQLDESSLSYKAVKTGKIQHCEYDASFAGKPVFMIASPIFDMTDRTKVVASFNVIIPKENAAAVRRMSGNLSQSLEQISDAIQELAVSAAEINQSEQALNRKITEINQYADQISEIATFIRQIADETKMLGLNAAIEAARAGEEGRGFGVVAQEIRKLSDESRGTVASISSLINNIKNCVTDTLHNSDINLRSSEEQAAATQQITAGIEEISSMSHELEKLSVKM